MLCQLVFQQPDPMPAGAVGAYEGAHYYHCGAFRPQCRVPAALSTTPNTDAPLELSAQAALVALSLFGEGR